MVSWFFPRAFVGGCLCLALIATAGPAARAAATGTEAAWAEALFAGERLIPIQITVASNDWNLLRHEHHDLLRHLGPQRVTNPPPSPYSTFVADVIIDGRLVESVGLRKKGLLGSVNSRRPSVNLDFNDFVPGRKLARFRRLTLNNNAQDPSQLHQFLAARVFQRAGVPAPRVALAKVSVNGESLGIYSLVEPIDPAFLERTFSSAAGQLYEGCFSDFRPVWMDTFEAKNHTRRPDRTRMQALVDALAAPGAQALEQIGRVLDIDAFLSFWAAEVLIGHWDGYCNDLNNFYVYCEPKDNRWRFIPWGTDGTFGDRDIFTRYHPPATVRAAAAVPRRLYLLPATRDQYRERLRTLLRTAWDEPQLAAEIDRQVALVRNELSIPVASFRAGVEQVRLFVRKRREALEPELAGPAPDWPHPLRSDPWLKPVGHLTSLFQTTWRTRDPRGEEDTASMHLVIRGVTNEFSRVAIKAAPSDLPRNQGSPGITLTAFHGFGKFKVAAFVIETEAFRPGGRVPVDGYTVLGALVDGSLLGDFKAAGVFLGRLDLQDASLRNGDPVRGKIDVELYELAH